MRIKTYRSLGIRDEILGLEPAEIGVLALVFFIADYILPALCNLAVTVIAYALIRIYKRNKPAGYTTGLLRFLAAPVYYIISHEE